MCPPFGVYTCGEQFTDRNLTVVARMRLVAGRGMAAGRVVDPMVVDVDDATQLPDALR
jgi:hypothetical protein